MKVKNDFKNRFLLTGFDVGKKSGFNIICDLNNDARADIKDPVIVAKNFGGR